jgi:uncharacterized protein
MTDTRSALRVPVADLLKRVGAQRDVHVTAFAPEAFGAGAAAVPEGAPVELDLVLERLPEGVVARGSLVTEWRAECSRCLADAQGAVAVHVDELFEPSPVPGETYPLGDDVIDLEPMVRDAVVLELPAAPLCRPDCAGLCPICGGDRNLTACDCHDDEPDPRWAALRQLSDS